MPIKLEDNKEDNKDKVELEVITITKEMSNKTNSNE